MEGRRPPSTRFWAVTSSEERRSARSTEGSKRPTLCNCSMVMTLPSVSAVPTRSKTSILSSTNWKRPLLLSGRSDSSGSSSGLSSPLARSSSSPIALDTSPAASSCSTVTRPLDTSPGIEIRPSRRSNPAASEPRSSIVTNSLRSTSASGAYLPRSPAATICSAVTSSEPTRASSSREAIPSISERETSPRSMKIWRLSRVE